MLKKTKDIQLSNNWILKKYKLVNGFYLGINKIIPGSGFIDFHQENLFVLSARGILGYTKDIENKKSLKQIRNNLNDFLSYDQFGSKDVIEDNGYSPRWFSFKDLLISGEKIFISYTEEIEENCWNTSVIYGKINYENIKFEKLFSPKTCIRPPLRNIDEEFNAHQSGGRIIKFDDNHILLSIGDYRSRFLAQKNDNVNGKIIKINTNSFEYSLVSLGHRNPQGLFYDEEDNFILETEHGPLGGDEINLIEIDKAPDNKVLNYGWPIASAGSYSSKTSIKDPSVKSHSQNGFIDPLISFVPSIGISEINKIERNNYVVSSLVDESIYFFELQNRNKIVNLRRVELGERVRDLRINEGKLFLFLENTASIGILNIRE
jgi:glucose/arabinose dehydrogenase